MTDLHVLGYNMSFGYKDYYNYYDIDVGKILLLKKGDRECFVIYGDVNKKGIVSLQIKKQNVSLGELDIFPWNIGDATAEIDIGSNDRKFFIKCREIWNKIIELMGIHDPEDFVIIDCYEEFIMLNIEKNTSVNTDKYRNDLEFVFKYVINNSLQASLVQYRY